MLDLARGGKASQRPLQGFRTDKIRFSLIILALSRERLDVISTRGKVNIPLRRRHSGRYNQRARTGQTANSGRSVGRSVGLVFQNYSAHRARPP
jgi:hypothetical protein